METLVTRARAVLADPGTYRPESAPDDYSAVYRATTLTPTLPTQKVWDEAGKILADARAAGWCPPHGCPSAGRRVMAACSAICAGSRQRSTRNDGIIPAKHELRRPRMTAMTVRLRTDADRAAVARLKATTGDATASRAIMRAVREYPDLVDQLQQERRATAALRTALRAVAEADDELARAEGGLRHALDQARAALPDE